jgi:hypothetical protein
VRRHAAAADLPVDEIVKVADPTSDPFIAVATAAEPKEEE